MTNRSYEWIEYPQTDDYSMMQIAIVSQVTTTVRLLPNRKTMALAVDHGVITLLAELQLARRGRRQLQGLFDKIGNMCSSFKPSNIW
jgi:hypothetical protein